jgi:hypothetical protein
MALQDSVKRLTQGLQVKRPAQPYGFNNIVYCTGRLKLIEKPETLLGERQRTRSRWITPWDPLRFGSMGVLLHESAFKQSTLFWRQICNTLAQIMHELSPLYSPYSL